MKYLRFKDLEIGQFFYIYFGAQRVQAEKTKANEMKINKVNLPGVLFVPMDPELNEDEVFLL